MSDADTISTLSSQTVLRVTRKRETADAIFGQMAIGNDAICYSMERTAVAIPVGIYSARKRDSAHFDMRVIGIEVPNRTDIEIHPANWPRQLEGCIAAGDSIDGDALDNSKLAFARLMAAVPESFTVAVESII